MGNARATIGRAWQDERPGVVAMGILCILALASITAPLYTQSPNAIDPLNQLTSPSMAHWFGRDDLGRDIFSRTMYAGRVSLGLGLVVTGVVALAGSVFGVVAGYFEAVDSLVMRVMDGMMAFPPLVLAIALVAVMGPGINSEFVALSVVFTPRMARVVRSVTLQLKHSKFVEAAKICGVGDFGVVTRHILPNGIAPLIVQASFTFAEVILADAALSFLGLGVSPPTPSWGNMVAEARSFLTSDPWFAIFPGIAIVLSVVSLNIAGDAIRSIVSHGAGSGTRRAASLFRRTDRGVAESNGVILPELSGESGTLIGDSGRSPIGEPS